MLDFIFWARGRPEKEDFLVSKKKKNSLSPFRFSIRLHDKRLEIRSARLLFRLLRNARRRLAPGKLAPKGKNAPREIQLSNLFIIFFFFYFLCVFHFSKIHAPSVRNCEKKKFLKIKKNYGLNNAEPSDFVTNWERKKNFLLDIYCFVKFYCASISDEPGEKLSRPPCRVTRFWFFKRLSI